MLTNTRSSDLFAIQSTDGTLLAMHRVGHGPPLLAVLSDTPARGRWAPIVDALSEWFTLYLLDRRAHDALAREAEDAACVIESIDEPVFYLGHSYEALKAIETLLLTNTISKALLYQPPPLDSANRHYHPDRYASLTVDDDPHDVVEQVLDFFELCS